MGLFPNTEFHAHTARIEPNDMLLLYTDGITEVEDQEEQNIFDVTGLIETIESSAVDSVSQCLSNIVSDAQEFSGNAHFDDDVCLIGMRLRRLLPKTTVM
jgi:serine phosphatase RsbU (regulator of sigma subunit)